MEMHIRQAVFFLLEYPCNQIGDKGIYVHTALSEKDRMCD